MQDISSRDLGVYVVSLFLIAILLWHRWEVILENLIFFPDPEFSEMPEKYGLDYEEVFLPTTDGVTLHAWYLKAKRPKAYLLFLHGNGGNISHRLFKTAPLADAGISVLLLDYRGFAKSQGTITKKGDIITDAEAGVNWLKTQALAEKLFIFGESIGSAPALEVSKNRNIHGLILEAPFTSIQDLAKIHYPFLPSFLAKPFNYDNLQGIGLLRSPLLILHGRRDSICPFWMGEKLFAAVSSEKGLIAFDADHNDMPLTGPDYFEAILNFISH